MPHRLDTFLRSTGRLALGVSAFALSGCAVRWYDEETGVEHVLGWTHVQVRLPEPAEGTQATVRQITTLGASVSTTPAEAGFVLGWNRTCRMVIVDDDASVRLEWPTTSLLDVRVGSEPPFLSESAATEDPTAPTPPTEATDTPTNEKP